MPVRSVAAIAAAVAMLTAGCTLNRGLSLDQPADGADLPILRERAGTFSAINRRARLVVHDAGTLATLPIDVGPVDFDQEMVLFAALGPSPSADYSIRIRRIWREGMELCAQVEVQFPPGEAPRRGAAASPYHLVIVPRCDLNVRGFEVALPGGVLGSAEGRSR